MEQPVWFVWSWSRLKWCPFFPLPLVGVQFAGSVLQKPLTIRVLERPNGNPELKNPSVLIGGVCVSRGIHHYWREWVYLPGVNTFWGDRKACVNRHNHGRTVEPKVNGWKARSCFGLKDMTRETLKT